MQKYSTRDKEWWTVFFHLFCVWVEFLLNLNYVAGTLPYSFVLSFQVSVYFSSKEEEEEKKSA